MTDPTPEQILRLGQAALGPPTSPALEGPTRLASPSDTASSAPTVAAPGREVPSDPADGAPAGRPFGRYRLLDELGRGGMGVVWKAWDAELRRVVALKLIRSPELADEKEVGRFLREARAAGRLRHPGIVPVHDVGVLDGQHYFTSDFVDGDSLERFRKRGPLAPRRALSIVKAVAEALHYAHGEGIVHRDVKPANVLMDREGRPFVTDFGLAKEVGPGTSGPTLSGEVLGTPAFMSPEQVGGRVREVGPPSDQFSLGVTLYLLLTEVLPFIAEALPALAKAITEDDPVPPTRWTRKIHPDAETICLKALEKDPARRYASLAEMAADIGRHLEGEPISARPATGLARWSRWAWKRKALVLPALAATAVAVGSLGYSVVAHFERVRQVERALAEETAAEAALEKGGRVQDVLARWVALDRALEQIEQAYYDSTLSVEQAREAAKGPWAEVQRFIDRTPTDAASQATMKGLAGWALWFAGRGEEGQAWIDAARRADPDLPYGATLRAMLHLSQYIELQPVPGITVSDAETRIDPLPPETPAMRGHAARMEELLDEAGRARVWGKGLAREILSALAAMRAIQAGRLEEAERDLTESLDAASMRPLRGHLLLARSRARLLGGRFEDALADLEALLPLRPRHAYLRTAIGWMCWQVGAAPGTAPARRKEWVAKAVVRFTEAIALEPGRVDAIGMRGLARGFLGDLDGAIADLDAGLRLQPGSAGLLLDRAVFRARRGDAKGAIEDCDALLRLDPESVAGYGQRGLARADAGDVPGALRDYAEAIRRDPRDVASLFNRALVLQGEGNQDGALADLDAAARIAPETVSIRMARSKSRLLVGDPKGAIEDLDVACRLDPDSPDPLYARAYARVKAGQFAAALADERAALAKAAPDWAYRKQAEAIRDELERAVGR